MKRAMQVNHLIEGYSDYLVTFLHGYAEELSIEDKIFDVGCGHMRNLKLLREIGFKNLYGIDRELTNHGIHLSGFVHGSIENNLSLYADQAFDVVICNYVLMFIDPDNAKEAIENLTRITGKFLVIETNRKTHTNERTSFKEYSFRQILTWIESMNDFIILHKTTSNEKLIAKRVGGPHG